MITYIIFAICFIGAVYGVHLAMKAYADAKKTLAQAKKDENIQIDPQQFKTKFKAELNFGLKLSLLFIALAYLAYYFLHN